MEKSPTDTAPTLDEEKLPLECEHLWHLANSFSLCLTYPDSSHNAEIQGELLKVQNILTPEDDEIAVASSDLIYSLRQKGVWLDSDCGRLQYIYSDTTERQGCWELMTQSPPTPPSSELIDIEKSTPFDENLLIEVMNDIFNEMTSQSIIFFTFKEIEGNWRERPVRKSIRRILQQAKDSKVQTLGEASKILVGDQLKTLTTAVDIQLLQDIMTGLDVPLQVPEDCSSSSSPPSPALSFTHSVSDLPTVPVSKRSSSRSRRGSVNIKSTSVTNSNSNSFDSLLAKKDKIINTVALALNVDGVFQNMLREGVRVMVHYRNSDSSSSRSSCRSTRRVQRLMKWKSKKVSSTRVDDLHSVQSSGSHYETLINKLEFYKIDVGIVDAEPEHSIIIDDVVEIYNGAFTEVFQSSLQHLHGGVTAERVEHEKRCLSMIGCQSYFDNRHCVDLEIIPRNRQFIKVSKEFINMPLCSSSGDCVRDCDSPLLLCLSATAAALFCFVFLCLSTWLIDCLID